MFDPGKINFGPYRLLEQLGSGATSKVYRATRGSGANALALKILTPEATRDDAWRRRFEREAFILRRLQHQNIVACLDFGELEGHCFMAMELVHGHSARSLVNQNLNRATLARIGAQLANGLAAAHAQGLIHRDLKPENIIVTPKGVAKILDFGLARSVVPDAQGMPLHLAELTSAGMVVGTPRYMSPEQSRGETLTPATDLFCLGLCLFELATGRHAFAAPSTEAIVTGIREKPLPPLQRWRPDLPPALGEVIASLLAKDAPTRPSAETASERFRALAR